MASVFLSYDRDDVGRAKHFAHALEKAGHQVWWDTHVRGGAQFSKAIEEALASSDVVVVLWSKQSIESAWVRDEAGAGRDTGRLIPVTIDGTVPPMGFRQFQSIDLARWKGRGNPQQLQMFLADVDALAKGERKSRGRDETSQTLLSLSSWPRRAVPGIVVALGAVVAVAVWSPWTSRSTVPTLLVTAGRNDAASQVLARDLAVRLGSLPAVQSGTIRLVSSEKPPSRPALVFELTSLGEGQTGEAGLLLRTATDGAIIWSQNFERGMRSADDTKLQIGLTAARVLGCESDVLEQQEARLSERNRTLYLTACAQTIEGGNYDPRPVVAGLTRVVEQAPRFIAAWRKLLIAEADALDKEDVPRGPVQAQTLRNHIAAARRLDPHVPEATVAEASLVPPTDLVARARLIDQAFHEGPNNIDVLIRETELLQSVGRMREAVGMAVGAMFADPMSPAVLNNYISALAYNGQTAVAEQQLKRGERLWQGTSTIAEIEWRFYFRIGNPKIGLQIANDQPSLTPSQMLFIQARANPTKDNVDKLISFYTSRLGSDEWPALGFFSQALAQFHRENQLYEAVQRWPDHEELRENTEIWFRPAFHQFRRDPRFMQLAARTPLLRYWVTTGKWPDFCKEPDLPYNCKNEAAKLHS